MGEERGRERSEGERSEGESGAGARAGTTNTNRSLNCKHDLKETEAARSELWPQVTAASAPKCALPAK